MTRLVALLVVGCALLFAPLPAFAQDDAALRLAEPDYTLVALPTALNVPLNKMAFRVTHRFTRPLDCEECPNSLAADAFGLDNGAQIGLELRYGVVKNGQVGVNRISDKTLNVFGQYLVTRQSDSVPIETAVHLAIDMTNVGRSAADTEYSPIIGVVVGRTLGDYAGLYLEPMFVSHANVFDLPGEDDNSFLIGIGARVRITSTAYITGEFTPRVSGYSRGVNQGSVSIEKRIGGHMFQINFSNGLGTTLGQIARGGADANEWHLGFNITRKFF